MPQQAAPGEASVSGRRTRSKRGSTVILDDGVANDDGDDDFVLQSDNGDDDDDFIMDSEEEELPQKRKGWVCKALIYEFEQRFLIDASFAQIFKLEIYEEPVVVQKLLCDIVFVQARLSIDLSGDTG